MGADVTRFYNLQVLRIAAATAVLAFHLSESARLYFGANPPLLEFLNECVFGRGVGLFFCISGFVIAHSLQSTSPRRFIVARLIRIYPAFWIATAISLIVRHAAGCPYRSLDGRLLKTLALLPGMSADAYELGVAWSLVFEIFYYCVAAALAAAGGRRLLVAASAAWLAACTIRVLYWPNDALNPFPGWRNIWFSGQNIPLFAGILLYRIHGYGHRLRSMMLPAAVGFLLLPHTGLVVGPSCALIDAAAFTLIVWFAVMVRSVEPTSILVRCGDWSYGVYLVHTIVIIAAYWWAKWHVPSAIDPFVYLVGALALFWGLAFGAFECWLYRRLLRLVQPRDDRAKPVMPALPRAA